MKKTICLLLVVALCFSIMPTCYASTDEVAFSDDPKAIQAASNSVIMLSCYDKNGELYATGSAFAAFEEGVFITNCHVIKDEVYSIKAQMETGLEFTISSVVAFDADRDLAILRTEAKTGLGLLPLGSTAALERAEKVIAIGSPLGLINTISIGLYSGTIKNENEQTFLQFSAPISHGSSGGALFNNKGEVVGITSASFTEGQNLNLAIPIEEAVELWEKRDSSAELSIPDFYELWDHVQSYSVSYLIANKSGFTHWKGILTEGYVYIDPNESDDRAFYLVESFSDLSAIISALEDINSYYPGTSAFDDAVAAAKGDHEADKRYRKRRELDEAYSDLIDTKAIKVFLDRKKVSIGDYIVIQADFEVSYLKNVVILEKNGN